VKGDTVYRVVHGGARGSEASDDARRFIASLALIGR
jgi:hypothetical protein